MTEAVWRYLEEAWGNDIYPHGDLGGFVVEHWPDPERAAGDLAAGWIEVKLAEEDEVDWLQFLRGASKWCALGRLPAFLPLIRQVLGAGLLAIGAPAVVFLSRRFGESNDLVERAGLAMLIGEFGIAASGAVHLLTTALAEQNPEGDRCSVRIAAAGALGQIGAMMDEDDVGGAMAGALETLIRVAGDAGEFQPLRTYCIEALMDLGPPARSAIPLLTRMVRDDAEDEDLRNFAWSALESVEAPSREHPCGGTVAEHMRSLYGAELYGAEE